MVSNFDTRQAIPHIYYVGLTRVTTIEGLYITQGRIQDFSKAGSHVSNQGLFNYDQDIVMAFSPPVVGYLVKKGLQNGRSRAPQDPTGYALVTKLCEAKISVSTGVKNEMERLRTQGSLQVTTSPMTTCDNAVNICFLHARSLHKHSNDIRNDLYYKNSGVCMFVETRFHHRDTNTMYTINGYHLYRNDGYSPNTSGPYGGTAIYSRIKLMPGYPYIADINGIDVTIVKLKILPNVNILSVYRSPSIPVQLCTALIINNLPLSAYNVILEDFNVNWNDQSQGQNP